MRVLANEAPVAADGDGKALVVGRDVAQVALPGTSPPAPSPPPGAASQGSGRNQRLRDPARPDGGRSGRCHRPRRAPALGAEAPAAPGPPAAQGPRAGSRLVIALRPRAVPGAGTGLAADLGQAFTRGVVGPLYSRRSSASPSMPTSNSRSCALRAMVPQRPVEPKPPAPRAVSFSSAASSTLGVSTRTSTNCAMRSPGSTWNGRSRSVFSSSTRNSPR